MILTLETAVLTGCAGRSNIDQGRTEAGAGNVTETPGAGTTAESPGFGAGGSSEAASAEGKGSAAEAASAQGTDSAAEAALAVETAPDTGPLPVWRRLHVSHRRGTRRI